LSQKKEEKSSERANLKELVQIQKNIIELFKDNIKGFGASL
jgi:hypothetical protein